MILKRVLFISGLILANLTVLAGNTIVKAEDKLPTRPVESPVLVEPVVVPEEVMVDHNVDILQGYARLNDEMLARVFTYNLKLVEGIWRR